MSKETQRWKNAEKGAAELLQKYGINAERISRGSNYAISDYDVRINGFPEIKTDSKYSAGGFRTSRLLEIVRDKYCKEKNDIPVLFCKGYREHGFKVTIDGEFFAELLKLWIDSKKNGQ